MALNAAAGRHMHDPTWHPVMPWVTNFTVRDGGWRDLTRSKFRLCKGDRQLKKTYESAPTPHHIPENLSELTCYVYFARRVPMHVLRREVRANFRAAEYPHTMTRFYEWTPDECVPEFFTDARVFRSIHGSDVMGDIELPTWFEPAGDVEAFLEYHRGCLESDRVSARLHHWIDLNFGWLLHGDAAVAALNVPLRASDQSAHVLSKPPSFVQLFHEPHPARACVPPDPTDGMGRRGRRRKLPLTHESAANLSVARSSPEKPRVTQRAGTSSALSGDGAAGDGTGGAGGSYAGRDDDSVISPSGRRGSADSIEFASGQYRAVTQKKADTDETATHSKESRPRVQSGGLGGDFGSPAQEEALSNVWGMPSTPSPRRRRSKDSTSPKPRGKRSPGSGKRGTHGRSAVRRKSAAAQISRMFMTWSGGGDDAGKGAADSSAADTKRSKRAATLSSVVEHEWREVTRPPAVSTGEVRWEASGVSARNRMLPKPAGHHALELAQAEAATGFCTRYDALLDPAYDDVTEDDDPQARDLFALGCVAAQLFAGEPLFSRQGLAAFVAGGRIVPDGGRLQAVLHRIPADVRAVVESLIGPEGQRPAVEDILDNHDLFPAWFPAAHDLVDVLLAALEESRREWAARKVAADGEPQPSAAIEDALRAAEARLREQPVECALLVLPMVERVLRVDLSGTAPLNAGPVLAGAAHWAPVAASLGPELAADRLGPVLMELFDRATRVSSDLPGRLALQMAVASPAMTQGLISHLGAATYARDAVPRLVKWLESSARTITGVDTCPAEVCMCAGASLALACGPKYLGDALATRYILPPLLKALGRVVNAAARASAPPSAGTSADSASDEVHEHESDPMDSVRAGLQRPESHLARTIGAVVAVLPASAVFEFVIPHLFAFAAKITGLDNDEGAFPAVARRASRGKAGSRRSDSPGSDVGRSYTSPASQSTSRSDSVLGISLYGSSHSAAVRRADRSGGGAAQEAGSDGFSATPEHRELRPSWPSAADRVVLGERQTEAFLDVMHCVRAALVRLPPVLCAYVLNRPGLTLQAILIAVAPSGKSVVRWADETKFAKRQAKAAAAAAGDDFDGDGEGPSTPRRSFADEELESRAANLRAQFQTAGSAERPQEELQMTCIASTAASLVVASRAAAVGEPGVVDTLVLPVVGEFFMRYCRALSELATPSASSEKLRTPLHVARALFLPLAQIVGGQAMHHAAPSVSHSLFVALLHGPGSGDGASVSALPPSRGRGSPLIADDRRSRGGSANSASQLSMDGDGGERPHDGITSNYFDATSRSARRRRQRTGTGVAFDSSSTPQRDADMAARRRSWISGPTGPSPTPVVPAAVATIDEADAASRDSERATSTTAKGGGGRSSSTGSLGSQWDFGAVDDDASRTRAARQLASSSPPADGDVGWTDGIELRPVEAAGGLDGDPGKTTGAAAAGEASGELSLSRGASLSQPPQLRTMKSFSRDVKLFWESAPDGDAGGAFLELRLTPVAHDEPATLDNGSASKRSDVPGSGPAFSTPLRQMQGGSSAVALHTPDGDGGRPDPSGAQRRAQATPEGFSSAFFDIGAGRDGRRQVAAPATAGTLGAGNHATAPHTPARSVASGREGGGSPQQSAEWRHRGPGSSSASRKQASHAGSRGRAGMPIASVGWLWGAGLSEALHQGQDRDGIVATMEVGDGDSFLRPGCFQRARPDVRADGPGELRKQAAGAAAAATGSPGAASGGASVSATFSAAGEVGLLSSSDAAQSGSATAAASASALMADGRDASSTASGDTGRASGGTKGGGGAGGSGSSLAGTVSAGGESSSVQGGAGTAGTGSDRERESWPDRDDFAALQSVDALRVVHSFEAHSGGLASMAVAGSSEARLATGGSDGNVAVWALDSAASGIRKVGEISRIDHDLCSGLKWMGRGTDSDGLLASVGGSVCMSDVRRGSVVASYRHPRGRANRFLAIDSSSPDACSPASSYGMLGFTHERSVLEAPYNVLATTSSAACSIDVRCASKTAGLAAEWKLGAEDGTDTLPLTVPAARSADGSAAGMSAASYFGLSQCLTAWRYACAVGSASGCVGVVDVRTGGVTHRWRAHMMPVVAVLPLVGPEGAVRLVTVAADHSAAIWDLSYSASADDNVVAARRLRRVPGLDSAGVGSGCGAAVWAGDRDPVLLTGANGGVGVAPLPVGALGSDFCESTFCPLADHRGRLDVSVTDEVAALTVLPLRRVLLAGGANGRVFVCA